MKRLKYFALAALVAFAACDEGDEVVVPEPDVGTISGTVTVDGTGLAGVTVTLSSGATATTAANGDYAFSGVQAGAYTVSISGTPSDAAFPTTSKAAVISQAGQVVDVDFAGSFITTSAISASVSVPGTGPLSGATVAISGQSSASAVTGSNGTVTFSGLRAGSYTVTATLSSADAALYNLDTPSVNVTLDVDELEAVAFTATPKTISTISGRMYIDESSKNNAFDAGNEDNLTIADVDVVIEGVSVGVFDTIQTDANGEYTLAGLPAANYRISLDTSPFNGAVALGTQNDVVITLGVADSEVVNFGFDIIEQQIVIGAFLGADEDNGPSGVASRVEEIPGVDIDIYTTAQAANNAPGPGFLDDANTASTGLATITFDRADDTDPFGGPSDNVVFARVGGLPAAFAGLVQNGEAVIEVPFPAKDSIITSADVFDYLNNAVTVAFKSQESDGDTYANFGTRITSDTTLNPLPATVEDTDADGMTYFDLTATGTYYTKTRTRLWPNFVANSDIPFPPNGVMPQTYPFTETFDEAAGSSAGSWLEFEYDGTSLPTDTIFIGTGNVNWDNVRLRGRVFREWNDVQNYQSGVDPLTGVAVTTIQLQWDSAGVWTNFGMDMTPPNNDGGFGNGAAPSGLMYRYQADTDNNVPPSDWAVLDETIVEFEADGSDQAIDICPLRAAGTTTYPTCGTFAVKSQNNVISGSVFYRDGTAAPNGTQVRVSVDADNTIQGRASTAGDTIVTVAGGAGAFATNATVREGVYLIEPIGDDDISFFASTNGAEKSAEIQGAALNVGVATATPARSALASGTPSGTSSAAASFHGFDPNTSIEGVVVNDRDDDGNTIDTNEALIGVTVNLYRDDIGAFAISADSLIATATTGADGSYSFEDLLEGAYTVTVEGSPADAVVISASTVNNQRLRMVTEAGVPALGDTNPVPLPRWDYGMSMVENPGTIDANRLDGEQFTFLFTNGTARGTVTSGGSAVNQVTVTIIRCAVEADAVATMPSAGTCDTDATGTFQNFITGTDGVYNFTDLREGIYEVEVVEESVGLTTGGAPFLIWVDGNGDLEVVDYTIS